MELLPLDLTLADSSHPNPVIPAHPTPQAPALIPEVILILLLLLLMDLLPLPMDHHPVHMVPQAHTLLTTTPCHTPAEGTLPGTTGVTTNPTSVPLTFLRSGFAQTRRREVTSVRL